MNYLSLCSGIEAASVAWEELGFSPLAFSEIEPFPCEVLAQRFPAVPNLGDMTQYEKWKLPAVGILVGGTPCQAFSIAGQRGSLDDDRGNLCLTFCKIADKLNPEWVLWENVPGLLSTKDNAFGCFLGELCGASEAISPNGKWANCGVVSGPKRTVAWRILDAQWFGVPQRRRRMFVLASRGYGNFGCADALLPLAESLPRYFTQSRGKRDRVTQSFEKSTRRESSTSDHVGSMAFCGSQLIVFEPGASSRLGRHIYADVSPTLKNHPGDNLPCFCYERAAGKLFVGDYTSYNCSISKGYNGNLGIFESYISPTILAKGPGIVCVKGVTVGRQPNFGGNGKGFSESGVSYTVLTAERHVICYENHPSDSRIKELSDGVSSTVTSKWGTGGGQCQYRPPYHARPHLKHAYYSVPWRESSSKPWRTG